MKNKPHDSQKQRQRLREMRWICLLMIMVVLAVALLVCDPIDQLAWITAILSLLIFQPLIHSIIPDDGNVEHMGTGGLAIIMAVGVYVAIVIVVPRL